MNVSPIVEENHHLIRQMEAGGIRTLLYGSNANLYHVAVSEYRDLLGMLAGLAGPVDSRHGAPCDGLNQSFQEQ